jgi:hypothetical protein
MPTGQMLHQQRGQICDPVLDQVLENGCVQFYRALFVDR